MKKNAEILNELKRLNSDLPVDLTHPYKVPESYFDELPNIILSKIKFLDHSSEDDLKLSSTLLAAKNLNPYSVPDNYFENNIRNLPFVFGEERSAVLETIGKEMPYTVPADYFDNIDSEVRERIPRRAKVVTMGNRWMRIAAAAMLVGVIGLAGYNYYQENQQPAYANRIDTMQQQTAVLVQDKKVESELKKVSTNDLETFIRNVEMPGNTTASVTKKPAPGTLKEELKDISVQELDQFLEQIPTGNDELSVID